MKQDAALREKLSKIEPLGAYVVLPGIHRVFSNLKTWALGVYHVLRRKHLKAYLDEYILPQFRLDGFLQPECHVVGIANGEIFLGLQVEADLFLSVHLRTA
jgi:ISXO2-like transposase domain